MTSNRTFTRFSVTVDPPRIDQIPEGGFCLSSFLVLSRVDADNEILLGKLNKEAPWERIGALDRNRAERDSDGWMLPASHLLFGESPQDAAQRILDEQLGLKTQRLEGPMIFSEMYGPKNHWDLEFVFLGKRIDPVSHSAWKELRFVDVDKLRKEDFVRSHEDILAHIGKWKG